MSTFGIMVARIDREIRRDGITAEIKDAIVSAIDYYEQDRYWFTEAISTASTTSGQASYAFTTNYLEVERVDLTSSASQTLNLRFIPYNVLNDRYYMGTFTKGQPEAYSIFRNEIYVGPIPDRTYVLKAHGNTKVALDGTSGAQVMSASASDASTNAWMTFGEPLIRHRAKADLFLNRLRNPQMAQVMQAVAEQQRKELLVKTVDRISTGTVQKTGF